MTGRSSVAFAVTVPGLARLRSSGAVPAVTIVTEVTNTGTGTAFQPCRAGQQCLRVLGFRVLGLRVLAGGPTPSRTLPDVARVVVDVMLKPEIHDPQGEAIASACRRLGFGQVLAVRQGKRFEVELSEPADQSAVARVAELAGELLANPVIEEFSVRPA